MGNANYYIGIGLTFANGFGISFLIPVSATTFLIFTSILVLIILGFVIYDIVSNYIREQDITIDNGEIDDINADEDCEIKNNCDNQVRTGL